MRRALALSSLTLLLAGAAASPARAELGFKRCGAHPFSCARLSVPLDRSGVTPGRVSLFVERLRASRRPRRGVVFVLAGGPGQSASLAFDSNSLDLLDPAFRRNDLIVYDQRGTGRSGLLRCRALERSNLFDGGIAAAGCARRLGDRRFHYTSRDSADDIEAIRREMGIPRISLFGTSYGTKVALAYALSYPDHVERLVLDSVVEAQGPHSLYLDTIEAVPRALRAVCRARCRAFTKDPVADLNALVRRIGGGALRGRMIDARGRRRQARLTRGELLLVLLSGDFDPSLRAAFPGAVRAALDGDPAPLLRLKRRSFDVDAEPPPPRFISSALFAATTCEETLFPWERTTPPDPAERLRRAREAAAGIPASAFFPFDRGSAVENDLIALCDRWPAAPEAPDFGPGPLPDVPVLLMEGEDDLRTPVENAERVAALFPRSTLITASATGHSVLGSDLSGCAERAFERFFRDRPVRECKRARRQFRAGPPPPTALRQVPHAEGVRGARGRALTAVALTITDVAEDSLTQFIADVRDPDFARGGGLRAGHYRLGLNNTAVFSGVAYVPGLRITGRLRRFGAPSQRGRLRVHGPAGPSGLLTIRGRLVRGRLGGRRVSTRLDDHPSLEAARAAARLPGPG